MQGPRYSEKASFMGNGKLWNRVAIITGAANGCGRAAVRAFLAEGAIIVGADRDRKAGEELAAEVSSSRFVFVHADVSDRRQVADVIQTTFSSFGQIDILHNQAGSIIVKPLLEMTDEDYDSMMVNNAKSVFLTTQAVLPIMLRQGRGVIVNTSSVSAFTATPMEAVYCSSKAAVAQFTRSVAVEFRDQGIRANVICPGFVRTQHGTFEISQLRALGVAASEEDIKAMQGRMCEPEEVAKVALFLASDDSSFMNGSNVVVDNTFTAI